MQTDNIASPDAIVGNEAEAPKIVEVQERNLYLSELSRNPTVQETGIGTSHWTMLENCFSPRHHRNRKQCFPTSIH